MPPIVRPVREEEMPAFLAAMGTSFLDRPDEQRLGPEFARLWDLERTLLALDGEVICGTYRSWASELTVPGGARLPAAAVTAVSVRPTHRRRGILRSMLGAAHADIRARGEALALLYASEYPIYGRFGYGPGTRSATWTLDTRSTQVIGQPGHVDLATPDAGARQTVQGVFEAWRLQQVGEMRRLDYFWDLDLGLREALWGPPWKGFLALHRDASGTVDGYVRYTAEEKWEERQPRGKIKVDDLHALTPEAYRALWHYLAGIDLASTIRSERGSVDEPLPWLLTNARAATPSDVGDALWVRLMDVPRALEARSYERSGRLVLEVSDRGGESQRLELDAGPDGARCRPSRRAADLTLDRAALGAAYLGGTPLRDAVLASGADEHRPGSMALADGLLRTLASPWCTTFF
jgi:predicted acetyltransferase